MCAGAYACNLVLFGIVYPRRRFRREAVTYPSGP